MPHLLAVAPALPEHSYSQEEIVEQLGPAVAPRERLAALTRLHRAAGVRTRHLALPLGEYGRPRSFEETNDDVARLGLPLAAGACREALDAAGLTPRDVDLVVFTTVTGIGAPALDVRLVEELGMRTDVARFPSFGLGCAGGAAGLARVADHLRGRPDQVALLVAVELCSLTLQHDDDSTANLVSTGLFGDGAAAVLAVGDEHPRASTGRASLVGSRSGLVPGTADHLGWRVGGSGLRIMLSAGLPEVLRDNLAEEVKALLAPHGLAVDEVGSWVVHAGGPKVLDAVQDSLGLPAGALVPSREVLAAQGNLSSASVLHVLDRTLRAGPESGAYGVVMAFGPGVGIEMVLLRWAQGGAAC